MIDENRVEEIVGEICESYSRKRTGGFKARCPVCGDSSKNKRLQRLHVDWYQKYDTWVVTCYNGGCSYHSGDIYSLYAEVTGSTYGESKKYINQETYNTEEIKKRLSRNRKKPAVVIDDTPQYLDLDMNDCLSVKSDTKDRIELRYLVALQQFMLRRGIFNHDCFIAHAGKYKGRIIVPVFISGEMVYFQGRSVSKDVEPKYLNPVVDKSTIMLNSDNFDRSKSIIVTEGIIDAWMVEDNQGTCVLGAYFDDEFIKNTLTMTDESVIICFDNPLIDDSGRKVLIQHMSESKYKNKVKYFLPDRKDFKDLNDLSMIYRGSIYDYVCNNSFSALNIKVKMSLLYK
ncbi:MAG: hypothetical protein KAS32_03190 [Candidatus Peribacteraceae bacterium]|nr:hypothetical protein [Candidatus Peribacteraceae bacterium]